LPREALNTSLSKKGRYWNLLKLYLSKYAKGASGLACYTLKKGYATGKAISGLAMATGGGAVGGKTCY